MPVSPDLTRTRQRLVAIRSEIRRAALESWGPGQSEALRPLMRAELALLWDYREALRRWLVAQAR